MNPSDLPEGGFGAQATVDVQEVPGADPGADEAFVELGGVDDLRFAADVTGYEASDEGSVSIGPSVLSPPSFGEPAGEHGWIVADDCACRRV